MSFGRGWQQRRKDLREAAWPWPGYSPLVLMYLIPQSAAGGYSGNTAFTLVVSWQLRQTEQPTSKTTAIVGIYSKLTTFPLKTCLLC